MNIYAVVCNGSVEGLSSALGQYQPRFSCLYNEPIDDDILRNAPFLIEVNEGIKAWLASLNSPWGIYLFIKKVVSFNEFRQHLRKFTYVKIPSQKIPVMFRFYDPRVFWRFVQVIDDRQLSVFLRDIELVASNFKEFKQDAFTERRSHHPSHIAMTSTYLTLSREQELKLNEFYQEEFILKMRDKMFDIYVDLSEKMGRSISSELMNFFLELSQDLYLFCQKIEVKDQHSVYALVKLFIFKNIYHFKDVPKKWLNDLQDESSQSHYRVRLLVAEEIGEEFYWEI